MKITSAGVTHKGLIRNHNEDNIYLDGRIKDLADVDNILVRSIKQKDYHTYAVFDGVGGADYGEKASLLAAQKLHGYDSPKLYENLDSYIKELNRDVCSMVESENLHSMGTTLSIVTVTEGRAYCCNLGDSRIFLYRKNKLIQLSKDHTQVQGMIDAGIIDESERSSCKYKHVLTQYIGMNDDDCEPEPYKIVVDLKDGDEILICSDGLTDMVSFEMIGNILEENKKELPEQVVSIMLRSAIDAGGRDNVSAILIKVEL